MKKKISEVDADGDGLIDFSEFVTMLNRKMNSGEKNAEMKAAFKAFDKDGSGKISKDDLLSLVKSLGVDHTEDEVRWF